MQKHHLPEQTVKVLVVGAGALGNEVIKGLVLSGLKNITIVDRDRVEYKNLERCVFFANESALNNRYKVKVIEEQVLKLAPDVKISAIAKNIEDLNENFFSSFDVVLGCVDSIEARLHINSHCYYYGIPYIDSGIDGSSGKVNVVQPPKSSCLQCGMNTTHWRELEKRFSCTGERKEIYHRRIETNIITASITAALQVELAFKVLESGQKLLKKNMIFYNGKTNTIENLYMDINSRCTIHNDNIGILDQTFQ
jgi:molybdopterin/thiamine biosynthesis adenylyltransferase